MPWRKRKTFPVQFSAPETWMEEEKSVTPENSGSQRVVFVKVSAEEINKRQLDPRIVDLQNLIDNKITIDPGEVSAMLNLTDPAEIEDYNSQYVRDAYKYLKDHQDEIFKKEESK